MPLTDAARGADAALIERLGNAVQARDTLRLERLNDRVKLRSSLVGARCKASATRRPRSVGNSCDFRLPDCSAGIARGAWHRTRGGRTKALAPSFKCGDERLHPVKRRPVDAETAGKVDDGLAGIHAL
jgi:hypothetical protein